MNGRKNMGDDPGSTPDAYRYSWIPMEDKSRLCSALMLEGCGHNTPPTFCSPFGLFFPFFWLSQPSLKPCFSFAALNVKMLVAFAARKAAQNTEYTCTHGGSVSLWIRVSGEITVVMDTRLVICVIVGSQALK